MIQIKDAIEKAKNSIIEIFEKPEKIQVEAFSLSEDKKSWNVTYSFWQFLAEIRSGQPTSVGSWNYRK